MKKNNLITLGPVRGAQPQEWEAVERMVMQALQRLVFGPALKEARAAVTIQNAPSDPLVLAFSAGRLHYIDGKIKGRFSADTSSMLRDLGAKWDGRSKSFKLDISRFPMSIRMAIRSSERRFLEQANRIDAHLSQFAPSEIFRMRSVYPIFDRQIFRMDKDFRENVKKIAVQPALKASEKEMIAMEYTENVERKIKGVADAQIKALREKIAAAVSRGERAASLEDLVASVQGVTANRVKFIARQEVKLFQSEFARARYTASGFDRYKWKCVTGSPAHPVRPRHRELSQMSDKGATFRWYDPPVTTEPGQPERRNNPGCDFNCRCMALVVTERKR